MKNIFLSGIALTIFAVSAFAQVKSEPSIDEQYLMQTLKMLSGAEPAIIREQNVWISERKSFTGKKNTLAYLQEQYESLGYIVTIQEGYSEKFGKFKNLIAEKVKEKNWPGKVFIIASHYDSVGNAGADDDATGTAAALALARAFSDRSDSLSLRFVAFDLEEVGLLGSEFYVQSLRNQNTLDQVTGMLQLEMLGYNGKKDGKFHIIDCDREDSKFLRIAVENSARHVHQTDAPLIPTTACTDSSDHFHFWNANIPAVVISQNFFGGDYNPCYHKQCDTVSGIHTDYMNRIVKAVAGALTELLDNSKH